MISKMFHLRASLNQLIAFPPVWSFIESTIIRLARSLHRRRNMVIIKRLEKQLAADLRVQSGPFKGMRYAQMQASCSAIFPKLLGTYESEIHPALKHILTRSYEIIVDVGSAEGYYAIGLALAFPHTQVVAFDIDPIARSLCHQNILINDLDHQVVLKDYANSIEVESLCRDRRSLIICDCEGFEDELFLGIRPEYLTKADILIETHDFICPGTHQRIIERFSLTHSIREYHSIDDRQKARTYKTSLTTHLDESVLENVYAECRPVIMKWVFLSSVLQNNESGPCSSSLVQQRDS